MTTPLQANLVDGDPDHAGKHNAERLRIEHVAGVASTAATNAANAQAAANSAATTAGQKYTKPTQGIPSSDLDQSVKALTVNAQTGTGYTLVVTDAYNVLVERNNAAGNTVTVPPDSGANLPIGSVVTVVQTGAGLTTVQPGTGVTITWTTGAGAGSGAKALGGQWSMATLTKRAANAWLLTGQLAG